MQLGHQLFASGAYEEVQWLELYAPQFLVTGLLAGRPGWCQPIEPVTLLRLSGCTSLQYIHVAYSNVPACNESS